jgi:aminobenzoyl-glutamate utilization protein B
MVISHKGMRHTAKAMAVTAAQLIDDRALLAQAKVEFEQATGDFTYKTAIPEGAAPPKPHI